MPLHRTLIALSTLGPGLLCLPAVAGERPPAQEAMRRACTSDYMAHCGEHAPGGPEVEACFRAKRRLLSPDCAAAIAGYENGKRAGRRVTQAP